MKLGICSISPKTQAVLRGVVAPCYNQVPQLHATAHKAEIKTLLYKQCKPKCLTFNKELLKLII